MITYYVLQNDEGKYFKARGQNSYKPRWVDDLQDARLYGKKSIAEAQATRWHTHYKGDYPRPAVLELHLVDLNKVHVLKKFPWACSHCGELIYSVTYDIMAGLFVVTCPTCDERFYT